MNNLHRYILEPYKGMNTRYHCPGCNHRNKTFALYIDTLTGKQLNPHVGRCNREDSCGYHYTPKQYFQDNDISFEKQKLPRRPPEQQNPASFIPVEVFKDSLKNYEANNFVTFLIGLFGEEVTSKLISRYFIGTSNHWNGSTVFWQIDTRGKVHTGKIMLYDTTTGKRVKEPFNHITWVHKAMKQPDYELKQCLFGEHLLKGNTKIVSIVESEKTAIIASVYLPQFVWLAAGSLTNLNAQRCHVLKGRTVVLFPDLNGFDKWNAKAKELSQLIPEIHFEVSDLLESKATKEERRNGLDLADYLIKLDWQKFQPQTNEIKQGEHPEPTFDQNKKEASISVINYWKYWPQALDDFKTNRTNMRDSFFRDFKKRNSNITVTFEEFKTSSLLM